MQSTDLSLAEFPGHTGRGHIYTAYGLVFRSELPLPELESTSGVPDVDIRLERHSSPSNARDSGRRQRASSRLVTLTWDGVGTFTVANGRLIHVEARPEVSEGALRLAILGPALGVLLRQRGCLVLHASAVAVSGRGVVFLGHSGQGKSTTAAVLCSNGHELLSDDVTAVVSSSKGPMVLPGYAQIKLWPEVTRALGFGLDALPRLQPSEDKRALALTRPGSLARTPLRRLFALAEGPVLKAVPLTPQQAFVTLVRYTYRAQLVPAFGADRHFGQCVAMASNVGLWRLEVPRDLNALPSLAQFVLGEITTYKAERS